MKTKFRSRRTIKKVIYSMVQNSLAIAAGCVYIAKE
jgi:hypothetical protein